MNLMMTSLEVFKVKLKKNLFDRPTNISESYFKNKSIKIDGTDELMTITSQQATQIYFYLVSNLYIDINGKVTDHYKNDVENDTLKPLPDTLQRVSTGVHMLVQRVYDNSLGIEIENANATKVETNALNENFYKKEFKELWNLINHKYAYTVQFDSDELIKNSVIAIDNELNVTRLMYTVATGEQKI